MPSPDAPLVSVVMPTYNSRYTIEESIRSALEQSHPAVEVIVVDDGSEDGTAGLVRSTFGERIRLIEAPHTGRAAARNLGLSLAKGSYVQYLDADDILAPGKVEEQVAFLEEHPDFAGAYGNVEAFSDLDPDERWHFRPEVKPEGDVLPFMIESGFLLPVGTLIRTAWVRRVGGFDPALESNEDWDHWLRIAAAGGTFARRPEDCYVGFYRVRGGLHGSSRSPIPHLRDGVLVLERLRRTLPRETAHRLHVRRAIGHWRFGWGRSLLLRGNRVAGLRQMLHALREDRRDSLSKVVWIILGAALGGSRARSLIESVHPGAGGAPE